jgi:hypothetical protein
MIYDNSSLKKDLTSKGISGTSLHCERMPGVINGHYSEYIVLVEEIVVLVSVLRTYPNYHLKSFLHRPSNKVMASLTREFFGHPMHLVK